MESKKADETGRLLQDKVNRSAGRSLPANSFDPEVATERRSWGKGYIRINDLCYGDRYPNSYLDVYLPSDGGERKFPVYLYAHGGGFLFTGKATGDAIANASSEASNLDAFIEELLSEGFAVVSMEYAMAPEYRFPVAVYQMDEAAKWIIENSVEYPFDTDNIVVGGGSAGADMTELYALAVSSPSYAKMLGMSGTALSLSQIPCVIIDESALVDYVPKGENEKILLQVWFGEEDLASCENMKLSFVPGFIEDSFPPSYIISSNAEQWFYDSAKPLFDTLLDKGIDCEFFYPQSGEYQHGFLMDFRKDVVSDKCMKGLKKFLRKYVG